MVVSGRASTLLWEHPRGQILTECYAQGGDALTSTQWGAYARGVFNVWGPFFLVGRYEHYDQPSPNPTLNILTGGAVWKPFPSWPSRPTTATSIAPAKTPPAFSCPSPRSF